MKEKFLRPTGIRIFRNLGYYIKRNNFLFIDLTLFFISIWIGVKICSKNFCCFFRVLRQIIPCCDSEIRLQGINKDILYQYETLLG
jgi:hypothetical protein